MAAKMPRGAIPVHRGDLAASEPYQPNAQVGVFVPSGNFPSPNHELAAAQPYKSERDAVPESYIGWPLRIGSSQNEQPNNSNWAEEAFAKACAEPKVFIPPEVVESTARECGSSNFAAFMQTHGFHINEKAYLDGAFHSVDWANEVTLNGAIAKVGPVKICITSANFRSSLRDRFKPGTSGWAFCGVLQDQGEILCASLCGYGPLVTLVSLFERHGVRVNLPSGMPTGLCYAMFANDSIGILDHQSLLNITGEAWARDPTTIVKNLSKPA